MAPSITCTSTMAGWRPLRWRDLGPSPHMRLLIYGWLSNRSPIRWTCSRAWVRMRTALSRRSGDFGRIPDDSPKENVKASVPGTHQAEEAVIANEIPQTATVKRSGTTPNPPPTIDGPPKLEAIEDTPLQAVANASAPIIRADDGQYYLVQNGLWFVSDSPNGPWVVAASVPPSIYSIPPSSRLHYATYVYVYGSTPDVVYTGYTPGYLGVEIVPAGVVVYGTGYHYRPWIGGYWYPAPYTYGFGWGLAFTPWCGWSYG